MDTLDFIMAVEEGSMDMDTFVENVQDFVNSGIWKSLQGSWQRMVYQWAESGYCDVDSL
jgi:hypothetical protein